MCKNKMIQYVPRGYDYKAVEMTCGNTGIYGEPIYCESCEAKHEKAGHAPHQCRHGRNLVDDEGNDEICMSCLAEELTDTDDDEQESGSVQVES